MLPDADYRDDAFARSGKPLSRRPGQPQRDNRKRSNLDVDTCAKTVTLGGHVRTWAEHDAVVGTTWMAPGVMQVRDYLDITG